MSDKSPIEWTDTTWNPVRGCSKVSPGCKHCYAESIAKRFSGPGMAFEGYATKERGWTGKVDPITAKLTEPMKWKKPRRIFVNSMSDLFHEELSFEAIAAVFGVMAACPDHTFQVLTKRPDRAVRFFEWMSDFDTWPAFKMTTVLTHLEIDYPRSLQVSRSWPLPNVHIGVSVENQQTADERIPLLLQIPAAVRFLSCEPLLGPLELSPWLCPPKMPGDYEAGPGQPVYSTEDLNEYEMAIWPEILDWVIVGGESGPNARPCNVEWIRSIVKQCRDAGVPVFVKQDSGPRPGMQGRIPDEIWIKEFPYMRDPEKARERKRRYLETEARL